nr:Calx-beta domain-containing protein [Argonema galeatum]
MVLQYGFGSTFTTVPTWTTPGGTFDWSSLVNNTSGAVNGNVGGRVSGRGGNITTPWANGDTLWVRWLEVNDTGNDHGLGIDDFSLTALPTVSLTATDTTAEEGIPNTGTFRITRSSNTGTLAVNLSPASGIGTDYNLSVASGGTLNASGTIFTFNSGVDTADITFTAIDDIPAEANETFALSLATDPTYIVDAANNTGSVTIQQNDFAVTNTNDSGEGSLRQAITNANAIAGTDTVTFNITGAGPYTISPTSALPTISEAVIIDGYSQTGASKNTLAVGNNAVLNIVLDGTNAGGVNGLTVNAGSSTIQGLTINRFQGEGILIQSSNNFIVGNFIGTDATGTIDQGNNLNGITLGPGTNNTIGGTNPGDRNLISGNQIQGITIFSGSNTITGNYIGTDASGTKDLGNTVDGIQVISGSNTFTNNLISGNDRLGVYLAAGNNNKLEGNYIGTNAAGTAAIANKASGVYVLTSNNIIGGTTAIARNLISGNNGDGISLVTTNATGNQIQGNYIGTNAAGTAAIANTSSGIAIIAGANNNSIGSTSDPLARNVISGNSLRGISIDGNGTANNTVAGNYIGTDTAGTGDLGNGWSGIALINSSSGTIVRNNTISGNDRQGNTINSVNANVQIFDTNNNIVAGNRIGTNAAGTGLVTSATNGGVRGIQLSNTSNTTIGGTTASDRNIISGNSHVGVEFVGSGLTNNRTVGNYIGTDVTGTNSIANGEGVSIYFAPNVTIGGAGVGEGNVISGNARNGVILTGNTTTNSRIIGNYIGTNAAGTSASGNTLSGVYIQDAPNNIIGGTNAGERNIISGNRQRGVDITSSGSSGNTIAGNYIGTDAAGTGDIGNTLAGIILENNSSSTIVRNNTISNNDRQGNTVNGGNANVQIYNTNNSTLAGNFIGTNATGTGLASAAGNGGIRGIQLSNTSNTTIGGTTASDRNIISGNSHVGVEFVGTGLNNSRTIGNYIGTDVTGNNSIANGEGVGIYFAPNVIVGGSNAGDRNVISGNARRGVILTGNTTTNSQVLGNYIGTNAAGTVDLGNAFDGVWINDAPNNIIGGVGAGNVISGNNSGNAGVSISGANGTGNWLLGNFIGTNFNGTAAVGNSQRGVYLFSPNNRIGTNADGINDTQERNIISGNGNDAITLQSNNNDIAGNYLGTDITGTIAIPNADSGVYILGANNRVGTYVPGTNDAAKPNLLSGNAQSGVTFDGNTTTNNQVGGNFIGSDVTGNNPLPNNIAGVRIIGGANNNTLGGTTNQPLQSNIIAFNPVGVFANANTANNSIVGNRIFSNTNLGIDLGNNGITANDAGDGDTGANNLQNFPVLTFAEIAGSNTACAGTFNSTANTNFRLEFFANNVLDASGNGEGKTYIGFSNITTDASGNANFTVTNLSLASLGNFVTATVTNLTTNDTSEFSNDVIIDVPTVSITPTSISQNEGNSGTTDYIFTAKLSRATTQNVTLNYTTNDGTATLAGNDYIDNDNSITFTAGGSLTQTITVQAKGDQIAESDETFTVNLDSATNAKIDTTANIGTGTITNDDTASIIVTQNAGLTTTEAGGTATFTVKLNSQPTADVTINLDSDNIQEGKTDKSSLIFTSANWNLDQTVTIIGQDDFIVDGNIAYNIITAKSTSADTNYNNLDVADVPVTNTDNDNAGITITQSGGNTNIIEGGATDSYDIVLTSQPTSDVTIAINNGTQTGTSPTTVTFTSANWNIAQNITVIGINDNVTEGNHSGTISHTATSSDANYNGIAILDVTANITDNDNAGITITQSGGNTNIIEGGATDSYDIVLTSQPTSDVTIAINNGTQTGTSPTTVTFTSANWNIAQNITVIGINDNVTEGNHSGTISHTATSSDANYNGIAISDVTANITDNDNAGITITPTTLTTGENATTANFTVKLNTQPTADVSLNLTSSNTTEGTLDKSDLTFTAGNWNTVQTVTITGIDDFIADGDKAYQIITAAATSTDSNYNNVNPVDINVTNTDNDNAGFTITPIILTTGENGTTANFTVKLNSQPTADVILGLSSSNTAEGTIDKSSLTFTAGNWNTAQSVTIAGIDDNIVDGDIAYQVITAAATSTDTQYNNVNPVDINVINTDNDSTSVSISPITIAQTEGNSGIIPYSFTVNLSNPSVVPVTVAYTTDNGSATAGSDYADNDGTIAFNPGDTSKSITVNVINDIIPEIDETFTVNLTTATNATLNLSARQSTGIITNDDIEEDDCFCEQIVYPNLDTLTGEGGPNRSQVLPNAVSSTKNGTANNDTLIGSNISEALNGLDGDDLLLGNAGNDNLYGHAGNDTAFGGDGRDWISSNEGDDLLNGNLGDDVLNGNTGNDTARGGQGNDFVRGGGDNDLIWGDFGDDTLAGDKGNDTVFGGSSDAVTSDTNGRDLLFGGIGEDVLNGNAGDDTLFGDDGNDTVRGGRDNDIVVGNVGDDILFGDKGNDSLCGGEGNDTIYGGNGSTQSGGNADRDCICGGKGNDLLFGNEGTDKIWGDEGDDTLVGGKDDDTLMGGAGNDLLFGDLGNDMLKGGTGTDRFFLQIAFGFDTIIDFEDGQDLLGLVSGLTFEQLAIAQINNATLISVKSSGQQLVTLSGVQANLITQSDFVLLPVLT